MIGECTSCGRINVALATDETCILCYRLLSPEPSAMDLGILAGILRKAAHTGETGRPVENLAGKKFGRLTVLSLSHINAARQAVWTCRCECGTRREFRAKCLKIGHSRSCGCLRDERSTRAANITQPRNQTGRFLPRNRRNKNLPPPELSGSAGK